jgi:Ta0938
MFFCCDICAVEFGNMVNEVKKRTGWKTVDEIKMTGNYRGRECTALYQGRRYGFNIRFDSKGRIDLFVERGRPRSIRFQGA